MALDTVLWLGLLVVLGVLFVVTSRRMSALVARTRNLERFQHAVDSIDRRFAAAIAPVVRSLDDTRRHAGDPAALREQLAEGETILVELLGEARALAPPAPLASAAAAMTGELERAVRAAALVKHGLDTMVNTSRGRDLEAQTSLKRGALNMRHSHDAFARTAREVAALRPADLVGPATAGRAAGSAESRYPSGDADDA